MTAQAYGRFYNGVYRPLVSAFHGRLIEISSELVEVPVEIWLYNLGPNKFMQRLRFEDGELIEIESLGYGFIPK